MKATQDILTHCEKRLGLGRCPKSQLPLMGKLQESVGFKTRRCIGYSFEVLLNLKSLCFLYYAYFIFRPWSRHSVVSKPCFCFQLKTNFKSTPFIYHYRAFQLAHLLIILFHRDLWTMSVKNWAPGNIEVTSPQTLISGI